MSAVWRPFDAVHLMDRARAMRNGRVRLALILLAFAPVSEMEAQQYFDVVCQAGTYARGDYKASDSTWHSIEMFWNSQTQDWEIIEAGRHNPGSAMDPDGFPGYHAVSMNYGQYFDHYWELDADDGYYDDGFDDDDDVHNAHGYLLSQNLFSYCGWWEY